MLPSPVKMTASEVDLLSKCLEFSQALRSQGPSFKLSIKLGSFSFSLDSKETNPKEVEKKEKEAQPIADQEEPEEERRILEEEV